MIVVRVELWSAKTGLKTELARMQICNVGGTAALGHYEAATFRGRDAAALDRGIVARRGTVSRHPRLAQHVFVLVARALASMGYAKGMPEPIQETVDAAS